MRRVLIAGLGNVFHGDDAFGVEAVKALITRELPAGVQAADFGIRGIDFCFALLDGYDRVVVIDTVSRGGAPGTLYLMEIEADGTTVSPVETHRYAPVEAMRLAKSMGGRLPPTWLVGCEPATLDEMGLSPPVRDAIPEAVRMTLEVAGA